MLLEFPRSHVFITLTLKTAFVIAVHGHGALAFFRLVETIGERKVYLPFTPLEFTFARKGIGAG